MRTIVVSDVHAAYWNLDAFLKREGVLDVSGKRVPGWLTYQVGDLLHCGSNTLNEDLETIRYARNVFDGIAIGNHEAPFISHGADLPLCGNSYPPRPETIHMMRTMFAEGQYGSVFLIKDEWVMTHAGVHPDFFDRGLPTDPASLARTIHKQFLDRVLSGTKTPLFDAVDSGRGGWDRYGSIFWGSWERLVGAAVKFYRDNPTPKQIVGHTPRRKGYSSVKLQPGLDPVVYCIDVGSALTPSLSALVDDGEGTPFRPVVFHGTRAP